MMMMTKNSNPPAASPRLLAVQQVSPDKNPRTLRGKRSITNHLIWLLMSTIVKKSNLKRMRVA
jgi:hypothetical protein